jgi:hypothetical protein
MTWALSISCLSPVVDYEENVFEHFEKNAPHHACWGLINACLKHVFRSIYFARIRCALCDKADESADESKK